VRRFHELLLDRNEHPVSLVELDTLSRHRRNEPIYRIARRSLRPPMRCLFSTSAASTTVPRSVSPPQRYSQEDIRWQHRYVDITGESAEGRLSLDYTKFHDVTPENG